MFLNAAARYFGDGIPFVVYFLMMVLVLRFMCAIIRLSSGIFSLDTNL